MFRSQMKQICRKCKGRGTNGQPELTAEGKVKIAPPFQKGEGDRPQLQNCSECDGEGWAMYDAPSEVMHEGQKIPLGEEERRVRFNDALA